MRSGSVTNFDFRDKIRKTLLLYCSRVLFEYAGDRLNTDSRRTYV